MQGNDRAWLAYDRTINLKIPLSPFFFLFLLQYKEQCVFSLHFRATAWNFVKSNIRTQKVKFGSDPKTLPLDVHFTDQTAGVIGQKKNFPGFHFPLTHWKGHVLQTKVYKNIIRLFIYLFFFLKLLGFINYWNLGVHVVFLSKKIQELNVFVT